MCRDCTLILSGRRPNEKPKVRGDKKTVKKRRAALQAAAPEEQPFSYFDSPAPTDTFEVELPPLPIEAAVSPTDAARPEEAGLQDTGLQDTGRAETRTEPKPAITATESTRESAPELAPLQASDENRRRWRRRGGKRGRRRDDVAQTGAHLDRPVEGERRADDGDRDREQTVQPSSLSAVARLDSIRSQAKIAKAPPEQETPSEPQDQEGTSEYAQKISGAMLAAAPASPLPSDLPIRPVNRQPVMDSRSTPVERRSGESPPRTWEGPAERDTAPAVESAEQLEFRKPRPLTGGPDRSVNEGAATKSASQEPTPSRRSSDQSAEHGSAVGYEELEPISIHDDPWARTGPGVVDNAPLPRRRSDSEAGEEDAELGEEGPDNPPDWTTNTLPTK